MRNVESLIRPQALLVEDNHTHAWLGQIILESVGFDVIVAPTIIAGKRAALNLLAPTQPARPTLVLLDLMLPLLEASHLAAYLVRQWEQGYLHPFHLVAITSERTPERENEALAYGCERVLDKPLDEQQALELRRIVSQAPCLAAHQLSPTEARLRLAVQTSSERALQMVEALQIPHWTPEDAEMLLAVITSFPSKQSINTERVERLLLPLGGLASARTHVQQCAIDLQGSDTSLSDNAYGIILSLFLRGMDRSRIVAERDKVGLSYSKSRVYEMIDDLPERVSGWFQHQATGGEV